jgi:hypothetical protein
MTGAEARRLGGRSERPFAPPKSVVLDGRLLRIEFSTNERSDNR